MILRFFNFQTAFTGVDQIMLCIIFLLDTGTGSQLMTCIVISAVTARTGCSTAMLAVIVFRPFSIGEAVCHGFCGGVTAGTGRCSGMRGIGGACPTTGCQRMICILRGAVRTTGTGNRSLMLGA